MFRHSPGTHVNTDTTPCQAVDFYSLTVYVRRFVMYAHSRSWHLFFTSHRKRPTTYIILGPATGLFPYLGYELSLWTYTDSPVKIVDPLAQHEWSSNTLSFLTYYEALLSFNCNWCASVFYALDQFGGATCVNIRISWWWHTGSAEICRKETVRRICLIFISWRVG